MSEKELFAAARDGYEISILYYAANTENAPLLYEVHGGGFIGGHHKDDANLCRMFRVKLHCNVASVEYRYAPQKVYPTATEDSFDALMWLYGNKSLNFDRSSVFLIGHSAGANIVAGISLLCADKAKIKAQILDYPFLDGYINPKDRKRITYSIPAFIMKHFNDMYYPDKSRRKESLASPVYMSADETSKLPPTLIITCGRDSLREDGIIYAELLKKAGIPVKRVELPDAIHGIIETVPNSSYQKSWWLSKKLRAKQADCFDEAFEMICSFITAYKKMEKDSTT